MLEKRLMTRPLPRLNRALKRVSFFPRLPVALALSAIAVTGACLLPPHHGKDGYLAAIIDKHARLARTESPRLILVGGSNLAFGIDSARLEEATGLSVVNMGLHAGLGLKYMLDEIKPFLRTGDVVVVVPEYEQYYGFTYGRAKQILQLLEVYPDAAEHLIDTAHGGTIVSGLASFTRGKIEWYWKRACLIGSLSLEHKTLSPFKHFLDFSPSPPPYTRASFNEKGDVTAHLSLEAPGNQDQRMLVRADVDRDAIKVLNEFDGYASEMGVTTIVTFPCVPNSFYAKCSKDLASLRSTLKRRLTAKLAGQPSQYAFAERLFYDSNYHLVKEGIDKRMQLLCEDMKTQLRDSGYNLPLAAR